MESTIEEVQKLPWEFGLTFHFLVACIDHVHRLTFHLAKLFTVPLDKLHLHFLTLCSIIIFFFLYCFDNSTSILCGKTICTFFLSLFLTLYGLWL